MLYKDVDAHFGREILHIYIWSSVDIFQRLQYRTYAANELPDLLLNAWHAVRIGCLTGLWSYREQSSKQGRGCAGGVRLALSRLNNKVCIYSDRYKKEYLRNLRFGPLFSKGFRFANRIKFPASPCLDCPCLLALNCINFAFCQLHPKSKSKLFLSISIP